MAKFQVSGLTGLVSGASVSVCGECKVGHWCQPDQWLGFSFGLAGINVGQCVAVCANRFRSSKKA